MREFFGMHAHGRATSGAEPTKAPNPPTHKTSYHTIHGGTRAKGKRKKARPLSTKHDIHLVLKSKKAVGAQSLYKHKEEVQKIIKKYAKKQGVQIKDYINMGNHLHIKLRITHREAFKNFLRTITALIARAATRAKKGKSFGKFWDALAFTRIVKTKYEVLQLQGYFKANRIEQNHGYKTRTQYLAQFNDWLYKLKHLKTTNPTTTT